MGVTKDWKKLRRRKFVHKAEQDFVLNPRFWDNVESSSIRYEWRRTGMKEVKRSAQPRVST